MRTRLLLLSLFAVAGFLVWPQTTQALTNKTLGAYDTLGSAQDVVVVDNAAYIADGTNGVMVIDVTNPAAPTLLGSYDTPGTAQRLDVVGTYLLVADSTSLQILNIATPTAPTLTGTYSAVGTVINDVMSDGTYAYLLGTVSGVTTLIVLDVQTPAAPVYKSALAVTAGSDVVLSGNYVYLVGGRTLDVVNAYPVLTLAGTYTDPDVTADYRSVQLFGSQAYINDSVLGLHAINIGNPASPAKSYDSSTVTPATGYGTGIAISNGFVFLAASTGGLVIYDISSTSTPTYVDTYQGSAGGNGVTVANNVALLTEGASGVELLDVSHPVIVTLNGTTNTVVTPGAAYVDPGVTVIGGTVTGVSGTVDTSRVGRYTITYTITYGSGSTTTVSRTVVVGPTLEKVRLVNNTLTIKVGTRKVTLRPFPGYRGAVYARKAVVDRKTNPMYLFISTDAMYSPSLVVYNSQGKLLTRQALGTLSRKGLQVDAVGNPSTLSVFLALAPRTNGLTAWTYSLNKAGLRALGPVVASKSRGTLVMKFLKAYTNEYGFVTHVRGSTKRPTMWRYSGAKKKFLKDGTFDYAKLKWTTTSVGLR